jgi:hypothetical protein
MSTIVRVDRGGGVFAPAQRRTLSVNGDQLAESEKATFSRLLAAAEPCLAAPAAAGRKPVPDATFSRLSIERDGVVAAATWSDSELPAPCRELARWIESRSEK